MPLIATRGAASAQGFGEFAQSAAPVYIEDVFSTYLYTGTGATQTINNGIDLSGKGGLVWTKCRSTAQNNSLVDTVRGGSSVIFSNTTDAAITSAARLSFGSSSYDVLSTSGTGWNTNAATYASWTFREQPKFFDVVTYTGTGSAGLSINHNLGATPGCIIIKQLNQVSLVGWVTYHRSVTNPNDNYLLLNSTNAPASAPSWISPSSTSFTLGAYDDVNKNGNTYVAYLFAHNAGGFGASGTDNVITCGSYTGNGSATGPTVTLNYEPQWLMIKRTDSTGSWIMIDSMRGFINSTTATPSDAYLVANTSAAESTWGAFTGTDNAAIPLATGFQIVTSTATLNASSGNYIYIAIRRGPMKTPTSGTSVFTPVTYTGNNASNRTISTGKTYVTDWVMTWDRTNGTFGTGTGYNSPVITRLTGFGVNPPYLKTNSTDAEGASVVTITLNNAQFDYTVSGASGNLNGSGINYINWNFGRAPGFFDVVCYTCNNQTASITSTHNLGIAPEMMIVKKRAATGDWPVYHVSQGNTKYSRLNSNAIGFNVGSGYWNNTSPTATQFTVGTDGDVNSGTGGAIAYLFATVAGVSKVGSYTGTGTTQVIDCGFTAGARFVLIKRSDTAGDWYVWDSARGIVAGNDPYILINSTSPEVTNTDYVDTAATGFEISSTAPAGINANGGTYIFLAIA